MLDMKEETFSSDKLADWQNKFSKLKVLQIDDSPENQILIGHLLRRWGIQVESANNGRAGVDMALKEDFDLILMDIQMPEMDGYEATARLRANGYKKTIVALTAFTLKEDRLQCLANGFDDHLGKPLNRNSLFQILCAL